MNHAPGPRRRNPPPTHPVPPESGIHPQYVPHVVEPRRHATDQASIYNGNQPTCVLSLCHDPWQTNATYAITQMQMQKKQGPNRECLFLFTSLHYNIYVILAINKLPTHTTSNQMRTCQHVHATLQTPVTKSIVKPLQQNVYGPEI